MEPTEVINNLINIYHEHQLAHAYLIETNDIQKCYEDIKELIKMMSCKKKYVKNCLKCNLCNLINKNNLPSLITIEPDGKNIKKEAIELLKESFVNIPIYTDNNIYILKYPEKMNDTAFNKMLKFLEEPENNIVGFFLTENKDNVASTIVSRCEILKMFYPNIATKDKLGITNEEYDKLNSLAKEYINKIELGTTNIIWYNNDVLLKELPNRVDVINFLKVLLQIYQTDLKNVGNKTNTHLICKIKVIIKYLNQLNYNVNLSLLLDSLVIEMRQVYEN